MVLIDWLVDMLNNASVHVWQCIFSLHFENLCFSYRAGCTNGWSRSSLNDLIKGIIWLYSSFFFSSSSHGFVSFKTSNREHIVWCYQYMCWLQSHRNNDWWSNPSLHLKESDYPDHPFVASSCVHGRFGALLPILCNT